MELTVIPCATLPLDQVLLVREETIKVGFVAEDGERFVLHLTMANAGLGSP